MWICQSTVSATFPTTANLHLHKALCVLCKPANIPSPGATVNFAQRPVHTQQSMFINPAHLIPLIYCPLKQITCPLAREWVNRTNRGLYLGDCVSRGHKLLESLSHFCSTLGPYASAHPTGQLGSQWYHNVLSRSLTCLHHLPSRTKINETPNGVWI